MERQVGGRGLIRAVQAALATGDHAGVAGGKPARAISADLPAYLPLGDAVPSKQARRVDVTDWRPPAAPESVDVGRAAVARVYDSLLGGAHTFGADRRMAEQLLATAPDAAYYAWANRHFVHRAVRFAVSAGIRQVVDIGCGLPATAGSVHEVAWQVATETRLVYVDYDPVVVADAKRVLGGRVGTAAVCADLRCPDSIVDCPGVGAVVDWSRPVVLVLAAVLHFVSDKDDPGAILARLRSAVAHGSVLVISHASRPERMSANEERALADYGERVARLTLRSRAEVEALFEGWELVDPGVVQPAHWRPEPGDLDDPRDGERAKHIPGWAGLAVNAEVYKLDGHDKAEHKPRVRQVGSG